MEVPRRVEVLSRALRIFIIVLIIAVIAFGLGLGVMVGSVGVSEAAIIVDPLTAEKRVVLGPKLFIKKPWEYYVVVKYGVESLDMWTEAPGKYGEWPAVTCLTRDGLEARVDITVRWRLNPDKVLELYTYYPGLDWERRALAPLLREIVRNIIASYTAVETIEKRGEISTKIATAFIEAIKKEKTLANAIIVEGIDLRNIDLPAKFKAAVEAKLTEEQMMLAAKFKAERMRIEANASAQMMIIKAKGEAKAQIERSRGEALAFLIKANATAEGYRRIMEALGAANNTDIARMLILRDTLTQIEGNVIIFLTSGPQGTVIPLIPLGESGRELRGD
ncbi:MAG: hypothetical protein DRJ49_00535 [Thermoprotei archaeon]|nr:MAG: hypothetical protein DRN53_00635 [Thermoprotei archaeon]RLE90191.1 MAG: hypothetical protein DRJ49_00535 [Thermoprotei archaeon]